MTGLRVYALACVAYATVGCLTSSGLWQSASAQDIQFADHSEMMSRIQRLEGELAALRTDDPVYASPGTYYDTGGSCDTGARCSTCISSCCDGYCNVECGWYAGAERLLGSDDRGLVRRRAVRQPRIPGKRGR